MEKPMSNFIFALIILATSLTTGLFITFAIMRLPYMEWGNWLTITIVVMLFACAALALCLLIGTALREIARRQKAETSIDAVFEHNIVVIKDARNFGRPCALVIAHPQGNVDVYDITFSQKMNEEEASSC